MNKQHGPWGFRVWYDESRLLYKWRWEVTYDDVLYVYRTVTPSIGVHDTFIGGGALTEKSATRKAFSAARRKRNRLARNERVKASKDIAATYRVDQYEQIQDI